MIGQITLEEPHAGVALIRINREDALNALSLAMMNQLASHISALSGRADVRVVVLCGAGERAFCSGGDLVELANHPSTSDAEQMIRIMGDALYELEHLPVPVIAAINGYALGGGSEIALACDMRVVDDAVRMGFVQINMALTPGWGAGQRLLRAVGYASAMHLLLAGTALRVDDLRALGLAQIVAPTGQAHVMALTLAAQIAARPPDVVRAIKHLLRAGLSQPYDQALAIERDVFPPLWAAPAHLQAVEAFLNRQNRARPAADQPID